MKRDIITKRKEGLALAPPLWQCRTDAGDELASLLLELEGPWQTHRRAQRSEDSLGSRPVVLALPCGGVPVANRVALGLGLDLGTWSVRKLTLPEDPEYAVGALAAGPTVVWSDEEPWLGRLSSAERQALIETEAKELERRQKVYGDPDPSALEGRQVIVVDDGVATGLTARAALESLRHFGASFIVLATPVIDRKVATQLLCHCNQIVAAAVVSNLLAVGRWYADFLQVADWEVIDLLQKSSPLVSPPKGR